MSRGGNREGAGAKHKWIHGDTKVIRVPIALADRILEIAKMLDQGVPLENVTDSKTIDLSGVSVYPTSRGLAVYLHDLLKAGYKIRPIALLDRLRREIDRQME